MATKELQTRIALKYDSYENWTNAETAGIGANLVLLKGELGICEIPGETGIDGVSTVAPTVLFKVGDGEKPFSALPWASAQAADVHGWAKASEVKLDGKTIKFVGTDAEIELNYITEAEVKESITNALDTRITNLEAALGVDNGTEGSVSAQLEAIVERLDVIEGEEEGSIQKAVADATTTLEAYADKAEEDAIAAAELASEAKVDVERKRVDALEAADSAQDLLIAGNTTAIEEEADAREAADKAIEDKIGGSFTAENTVAKAIEAAQSAADAAQDDYDALFAAETGAITVINKELEEHDAAITQLGTDLEAEVKAREDGDKAIDERLVKVEAFFEGAAEDSEGLNDALDKLVDIQTFLSGEGSEVNQMLGAISENAEAIEALEGVVGDANSGLVKDMTDAKAAIDAVEERADALEAIVAGYEGTTIKAAVDAAQQQADKGVEDAGKAQDAADKAQEEIDALELIVGDENNGLVKLVNTVKEVAEGAAADTADLKPRMKAAEDAIDALEAIVVDGDDANAKLRADITSLQELTSDESKGNEKLRSDLDALAGIVNNETTGLAAVKVIADRADAKSVANAERLDTIEADYLKQVDQLIFQCGTASTVTFTAPVQEQE